MNNETIQHAIWAVFLLIAIGLIASCAEGVSDNTAETTAKYIESDCKRGPVLGSQGTKWTCD